MNRIKNVIKEEAETYIPIGFVIFSMIIVAFIPGNISYFWPLIGIILICHLISILSFAILSGERITKERAINTIVKIIKGQYNHG